MLGQKVGGHHGDRRILLLPTAAHRGAPFPTTLAPRSDSQGPAPWASRAPSRTRLARKAKLPATAWDSGSRGASGWRQMGEGRGGSTSRRRGESLITRACPGCPALCPLPLPGTSRACSPLPSGNVPSSNSQEPWGETVAFEPRSGLPVPGGRLGQPQRLGRHICQADGNSQGTRCRGELVILAQNEQHLLSPRKPSSLSRASLTTERGSHPKVMQLEDGARKHI